MLSVCIRISIESCGTNSVSRGSSINAESYLAAIGYQN